MKRAFTLSVAALSLWVAGAAAVQAGPKVVSGPGADPGCFAPWNDSIKYFQWDKRDGPHKVAVVNGFVGNTWRIQMIQTAKAYVEQPEVAAQIEEFKAVSTGTDVAAQLGAIEDFINQGFDAIITIAVSPEGFDRVIRLADRNNVVVVPFDNVLDTDKVVIVNEPQVVFEQKKAEFVWDHMPEKKGKILEIRGLPGNSVDRDRSIGMHNVFDGKPGIEVVTVVGNWDDGTVQKVVADAIKTHGNFAGMVTQHGATGLMNALIDTKHPKIPLGTSGENGSLRMIHEGGWEAIARVQSPAMSAVAAKAAIALLKGHELPQLIGLEIPTIYSKDLKEGTNYWKDAPDNFQAGADVPACGVVLPLNELLKQTPDNT